MKIKFKVVRDVELKPYEGKYLWALLDASGDVVAVFRSKIVADITCDRYSGTNVQPVMES